MRKAVMLSILSFLTVMLMTNCGELVNDYEKIFAKVNEHEQEQANLKEHAEKVKQAQIEKHLQLEYEKIVEREKEEFRLSAHLGTWFYTYSSPYYDDSGIGKLIINGDGKWVISDFAIGAIFGWWDGDANNLELWRNDNFVYPFGYALVNENGMFELTASGRTTILKRYVE
jgi:hypothetical protein